MPSRFAGAGTPMWSNCTRETLLAAGSGLGGSLLLLLLGHGLPELDLESLDPSPVDLDDAEQQAVRLNLVPGLSRPPEHAEDQAGERVVVLLRQNGAEA